MIKKIFDDKLYWIIFCIICFILFFAVAVKGYFLLSKIAPVIATISGVTGVSIIFLIEIYFQSKKDKRVKKYKILCWIIIAAMVSGFYVGKYGVKLVIQSNSVNTGALGAYNEAEKPNENSEMNSDEDFYPVVSPEKVSMDINKLDNSSKSETGYSCEDLLKSLVIKSNDLHYEKINAETKADLKIQLESLLKNKIGTGSQPTNDVVNGNREFTDKVEKANALSKDLDEKVMDVSLLIEIIELRENAFSIYQTKSLRKLLANNYNKLGKYYYQKNNSAKADEAFFNAIKYECTYIQMKEFDDEEYYAHLYKIGMIFQMIGDLEFVDKEYKSSAYIISSCLLEISATNLSPETNEGLYFFSNYYAGMVNHKLVILTGLERECYIFIGDALGSYRKSLQAQNYTKQQNQQYSYIIQISSTGIKYVRQFGEVPSLPTRSELREINNTYQKLSQGIDLN